MAWICAGQGESADLGAIDERQQRLEIDIVAMRTVPVSPTDVQTNPVARNASDCPVDRLNVQLDARQKLLQRASRVHDLPLEREIRSVQLQNVSMADDELVLLAHLVGEREHVIRIGAIVRMSRVA